MAEHTGGSQRGMQGMEPKAVHASDRSAATAGAVIELLPANISTC